MSSPTRAPRPRGWTPGHPVTVTPIEVGPIYGPGVQITAGESFLRCQGCGWSATVADERAAEVARDHEARRAA